MAFCNSYQYHSNAVTAAAGTKPSLTSLIPSNVFHKPTAISLRSNRKLSIQVSEAKSSSNSTLKTANLIGRRKERAILPSNTHKYWKKYKISEFLSHPSEIESTLNTKATQSFLPLGSNNYRCTLHTIQLLNYEIIPLFDLRVIPTTKDCTIEMLSCKFEGSEDVKRNNSHYSAFMRSHITWDINCSKPCLDVDMNLGISFEVYKLPFSLLPVSVVETPGNMLVQALVDNHARLLLQQLLQHYNKWVLKQCQVSS